MSAHSSAERYVGGVRMAEGPHLRGGGTWRFGDVSAVRPQNAWIVLPELAEEVVMTDSVTRAEAAAMLGAADEQTLVDVIATGATKAEVAEAVAWVANDEAMLNEGRPLPTGRVLQVLAILTQHEEEEATEL
jgi:hypothetical protein